MGILVLDTIQSELAINQEDGVKLYNAIQSTLPADLTINFIGISRISTAFLNESIGKFAQNNPSKINKINFVYPKDNEIFNLKVIDVIENALMGEEYSNLVDNALASL
jgi:hypothetical protein